MKEAIHNKMDRLERKLEQLAALYFGEDVHIVYLKNKDLKKAIIVDKEGKCTNEI